MSGLAGLILPIMALLIGGLLVALLYLWWSGGLSDDSDSTETDAEAAPADDPPRVLQQSGDGVLFSVARDPVDSALLVAIGGERYRRLADIPRDQRDMFLVNAAALASFIQQKESAASPATPSTPAPAPVAAAPRQKTQPDEEDDDEDEGLPSIARQINDVLQQHLAMMPNLQARNIAITDALDGGVLIHVDDEMFDGLDAIPDGTIRAVIQRAIQDWENSQPFAD